MGADAVRDVVDLVELPSGKQVQFVRQGRMGRIQFSDGGQLPTELVGGFTDIKNAQTAAESYVARLEKEGKKAPANKKVATRRVSK